MTAAWTRHPVIAGVVGVFAGAVSIAVVEWVGHQLLGTVDLHQPAGISTSMFAFVLLAWVTGAAVAALVATVWGGGPSLLPAMVAAGVLVAGSVATLFAVPHPGWMTVGALVLMPTAAWVSAHLMRVRQ
jgi:hypothetical protein